MNTILTSHLFSFCFSPLDDDVTESDKQNMNNQPLGLENIPIVGSDISSESNIE